MSAHSIVLRDAQPIDMRWVVQQHGESYWREQGWDISVETRVLKIVSGNVHKLQPAHSKCWIAEVDGAQAIYLKHGIKLTKTEPYQGVGHDMVGESWKLKFWATQFLHPPQTTV